MNNIAEHDVRDRIANDLLAAGLRRGGSVLVHSSLSSMGHVPGGPETIITGLLEALGTEGTLLMLALTWEAAKAEHPVFDCLRSPSAIGAIPEYFRTRPGTIRSIHPSHSVCGVGRKAEALLGKHHLDETPCGANSPYRALKDAGGQILFLGCGLGPNTSMHAVEELVEPPYLFGPPVVHRIILPDGGEMRMTCRSHNFVGYRQRYDRLEPLLGKEGLSRGTVLEAEVVIVECRVMWRVALDALRRDPFAFVERLP